LVHLPRQEVPEAEGRSGVEHRQGPGPELGGGESAKPDRHAQGGHRSVGHLAPGVGGEERPDLLRRQLLAVTLGPDELVGRHPGMFTLPVVDRYILYATANSALSVKFEGEVPLAKAMVGPIRSLKVRAMLCSRKYSPPAPNMIGR